MGAVTRAVQAAYGQRELPGMKRRIAVLPTGDWSEVDPENPVMLYDLTPQQYADFQDRAIDERDLPTGTPAA